MGTRANNLISKAKRGEARRRAAQTLSRTTYSRDSARWILTLLCVPHHVLQTLVLCVPHHVLQTLVLCVPHHVLQTLVQSFLAEYPSVGERVEAGVAANLRATKRATNRAQ